ncbi:Archaellum protein D/E [Halapricum desulfuricans]|uniref:Archaellum protein D/E n=2 Tax=Halapricum desulfuricans TaxID=2841257 RepID=A0A897N9D5_9EURY|nr:Archaellum protein D/E [Halapricum desulfuricans]
MTRKSTVGSVNGDRQRSRPKQFTIESASDGRLTSVEDLTRGSGNIYIAGMTINPKDYDLEELRKMAHDRERGSVPDEEVPDAEPNLEWSELESGSAATDDGFRARLYRELMPLMAGDDPSKPYLSTLPEVQAAEFLLFEWLEFLLLHGGFRGAREALDYYESIDWITDEVESELDDYLMGIEETGAGDGSQLDVDDHLLSLVYIAKLAAMQ